MPFHRYVALGDSFTEGVGDPDPDRPNGLRIERVRTPLGTLRWKFRRRRSRISRLLLPIPQLEIDANPNLTQNPGY